MTTSYTNDPIEERVGGELVVHDGDESYSTYYISLWASFHAR